MMESRLAENMRYAIRTLLKTPVFTVTALAALALGIGANTAIFSVIDTVLLKPLSFPDPDRVVVLFQTSPAGDDYRSSATKFNGWRRQTEILQDVSAWEYLGPSVNVTGGAYPAQIHTARVSADFFRLLGAPVAQGRTFTAEEDRPNGGRVTVLSYGLWQRVFGGDPQAVGKTISLGGVSYEIVGIVGKDFRTELDIPPDLWLPFQIDPDSSDQAHYFATIARLKPGVTLDMANAQLPVAADEFRRKFPNIMGPRDGFRVRRYGDAFVSDVRPSLIVLAGAVSFVLLIACANVANLLLVRATGRRREISIRAAIGAGRGHIIRQLLTESIVLSMAGGVLGLMLGLAGVRALLATNPGNIPRIGEHGSAIAMDWHVLAFTVFVSVLTGVFFGLVPALDVCRSDLAAALKEGGGRSGSSRRQNRTRALFVISETALALVLLMGASLLIRTFVALRSVDPGIDPRNILTMRMALAGPRFEKTAGVNQIVRDAIRRMDALPGVVAAGASYSLPIEGGFGIPFNIVGRPVSNARYDGRGWINVSPGYFDLFKIPVLRGRDFNDRDDASAGRVAIINQTLARQFWPQGDPIGERILLGKGYGPAFDEPAREIVGIVGDVHDAGLNQKPNPMVYVPIAQVTDGISALVAHAGSMAWVVRTRVPPHSLDRVLERELRESSGGLAVERVRSMEEVMAQSTSRAGFNMTLLTIFGGAALLLAVIGIYGLMAYSVEQRTSEIGIRLALGAGAASVRNMVMWQGMRLALIGVAVGIAAALALTRLIANLLFGVQAWDPLVFATVPLVLTAAALGAVWLPAVRAARTDPVDALRHT
jgi:predicted permease